MKKIVLAFGRFNPISIGHRKLAEFIKIKAEQLKAHTGALFMSHSYDGINSPKFNKDKCKNPLPFEKKLEFVEDAIGDLIQVMQSDAKTMYDVLYECYENEYTEVYIVGGDDRQEDWDRIKKYNGDVKNPKYYEFDKIEILSAGARNEDSDDPTEQASASLLRQCVKDLDYDKFARFAGTKTKTEEMFDELLYEMGIEGK